MTPAITTNSKRCSQCGAELTQGLPNDLCGQCLITLGLDFGPSYSEHGSENLDVPESWVRGPLGRIGDYELLEEIARGGMGVVYRARQRSAGRIVAIKMILAGQFVDQKVIKRFHGEVTSAALLHHPNIVAVHEVGMHAGQSFFSMDYVEGQNLAQLVGNRPLWPNKGARYVKLLAEAMAYAHSQGILHRDLKPSNVLVDSGTDQPRLTDFGLAKRLDGDSSLTVTGQVLGSPNFMPPEQAGPGHGKVGRYSDVYGLGAILYYLLTARAPFQAESLPALVAEVVNTEPVPPRLLNPGVPRDLETICLKCLEKEPSRRYQMAEDLADELGRFLAGEPVQARPISRMQRGWRWCRRKPLLASLSLTVLVLVLVVLIGAPVAVVRINGALARAERNLYAADMRQASEALRNGDLEHVEELLESHTPRAGTGDPRGFEWRYLARATDQSALLTHQLQGWRASEGPDTSDLAAVGGVLYNSRRMRNEILAWDMTNWEALPLQLPSVLKSNRWYHPWEQAAFVLDEQSGTIAVYKLPGCERVAIVPEPGKISQAAVSKGWRMLAVVFEQGGIYRVLVWDLEANAQRLLLGGYSRPVVWLGFSRDCSVLGVACTGGEVGLWSLADGKALTSPPQNHWINEETWQSKPFFDPCLTRLYLNRGPERKTLEAWDWSTGELATPYQARLGQLETFTFSPDNSTLATAGSDGAIVLVDTKDLRRVRLISASNSRILSLAFSPSGRFITSGSEDRCLKLWDVETFREHGILGGNSDVPFSVAFSPDEKSVVALLHDGTIKVWGLEAALNQNVVWRKTNVFASFALSADEKVIAAGDSLGCVHVFDRASGVEIRAVQSSFPSAALSFSPKAHLLAGSGGTGLGLLDYDSGQTTFVSLPGPAYSFCNPAFSPDGHQLAFADSDHIQLMDVATRTSHPFASLGSWALGVAFSPDLLASVHYDGTVKLWDRANGRLITNARAHTRLAFEVQFSPDGRLLATGGSDATGKLWEVLPSGLKLRHTLRGHAGWVALAFSPDGRRVVSSSDEDALKIWDTQTGLEVGAIFDRLGGPVSLHFSHDGNALYALGRDGGLRCWQAPPLDQLTSFRHKSPPVAPDFDSAHNGK